MISYEKSKKSLTVIWLIGFMVPFLILSLQTMNGNVWKGKESEAWALFTPMLLPTIGLIVGVLVADAVNPVVEDRQVNTALFFFTIVLSVVYLVLVIMIFLSLPRIAAENSNVFDPDTAKQGGTAASSALLDAFKRSGLMLGAIQGLVTTTMGVFFVNRTTKNAPTGLAASKADSSSRQMLSGGKPADAASGVDKQISNTSTP